MQSLSLPDGAAPQDVAALQQWLAEVRGQQPAAAPAGGKHRGRAPGGRQARRHGRTARWTWWRWLAQDRLSGSGDYGSASNSLNNSMIGVQLNVPLYTGGYRSARERGDACVWPTRPWPKPTAHAQQVAQADPRRLARPDGRRIARWRR